MNLKLTVGLILFALLMLLFVGAAVGALGDTAFGAVAKYTPFATQEERAEKSPWFYQVSFEDIISIEVNAEGNTERFIKNDRDAWVFERLDGIPPSHTRWGGIVLLVSGPQTRRDLTSGFEEGFATVRATIDDPAEYGLDQPTLVVKLGLTADRELEFRLGDKTTDGNHHYGQVIGFEELFLIADIWGEVLARLANEPPLPKWWVYREPGPSLRSTYTWQLPTALKAHSYEFSKRMASGSPAISRPTKKTDRLMSKNWPSIFRCSGVRVTSQ